MGGRVSSSNFAPMGASIAASRRSVFRQTSDRLGETARLTRIDLGERDVRSAQGALEGAVIGDRRSTDWCASHLTNALWPLLPLAKRLLSPSPRR